MRSSQSSDPGSCTCPFATAVALTLSALLLAPPADAADLLRNDEVAALSPRPALGTIFTDVCSADPSVTLDAADPADCSSRTEGEGSLLGGNGSDDQDDLYLTGLDFALPQHDPEPGGMVDATDRPLMLWQIEGAVNPNGLRIVKAPATNSVVISEEALPVLGACCSIMGWCNDTVEADCYATPFDVWLAGESCSTQPCPGKCCDMTLPGMCALATQSDCRGNWWPTDLLCGTIANCCISGTCYDGVDQECCNIFGGTVTFDACATNPC